MLVLGLFILMIALPLCWQQRMDPGVSHTRADSRRATDEYIKDRVGAAVFTENYRYEPSSSGYADDDQRDTRYDFIAYHFKPYFIMAPQFDDLIFIQVNRDSPDEIYGRGTPDCKHTQSLCNFTITENDALAIAKTKLNSDDLRVLIAPYSNQEVSIGRLPFVLVVTSCKLQKSVDIDYRTGLILDIYPDCNRPLYF